MFTLIPKKVNFVSLQLQTLNLEVVALLGAKFFNSERSIVICDLAESDNVI